MANELDIMLDPYTEYRDVVEWFGDKIGYPVGYQVRHRSGTSSMPALVLVLFSQVFPAGVLLCAWC